jgi:hypothetical protein
LIRFGKSSDLVEKEAIISANLLPTSGLREERRRPVERRLESKGSSSSKVQAEETWKSWKTSMCFTSVRSSWNRKQRLIGLEESVRRRDAESGKGHGGWGLSYGEAKSQQKRPIE